MPTVVGHIASLHGERSLNFIEMGSLVGQLTLGIASDTCGAVAQSSEVLRRFRHNIRSQFDDHATNYSVGFGKERYIILYTFPRHVWWIVFTHQLPRQLIRPETQWGLHYQMDADGLPWWLIANAYDKTMWWRGGFWGLRIVYHEPRFGLYNNKFCFCYCTAIIYNYHYQQEIYEIQRRVSDKDFVLVLVVVFVTEPNVLDYIAYRVSFTNIKFQHKLRNLRAFTNVHQVSCKCYFRNFLIRYKISLRKQNGPEQLWSD